jgi:ATP-dependent RNA helicase SUPV3L1/SUV3
MNHEMLIYHATLKVQAGDCVVAFSRNDIFAIKREIERLTPYKCCVVYGTLPPDTRISQARLFNDPNSKFDILVASDAVSMGLNLNIKRIVFNSLYKTDGDEVVRLDHSHVKQIAGRAGRRNSQFPNGEVTCRDPRDLPYLTQCLNTNIEPLEKAGLIPTASHVEMFGEALEQYYVENGSTGEVTEQPLHALLKDFSDMAVVKGDFFLCRQDSMNVIAQWLKDVELEKGDKYQFTLAPISTSNPRAKEVLTRYAMKLSEGAVPGLTRGSPMKPARSFFDLAALCGHYSDTDLFLWLQNKFPPVNLMEQQAAMSRRGNGSVLYQSRLAPSRQTYARPLLRQARHSASLEVEAEPAGRGRAGQY